MYRTNVVELTTIDAVAYRQRLKDGSTSLVIVRYDTKQPGIAAISRTSGEAIPTKNTSEKLYPKKA